MRVNVRFFASLRELVGERTLAFELPDRATVADLQDQLSRRFPAVVPHLESLVCAVADEYVRSEHPLHDGDDVALIPPVSGGADGPFRVQTEPLDPDEVFAAIRRDEAGAVVLFHGVARNDSEGRKVIALEYDAHAPLAEKKLRDVRDEVRRRWPEITSIAMLHRIGRLAIGETSLLVGISSPHRQQAFEASQYAVDRVKQIVPVWKKEIWEDGSGQWVPGYPIDLPEPAESR
jgi:molybdopterin synthase catalytic subunit